MRSAKRGVVERSLVGDDVRVRACRRHEVAVPDELADSRPRDAVGVQARYELPVLDAYALVLL